MNQRKYRQIVDAIMSDNDFYIYDDSKHLKYKHRTLNITQTCSKTPSDNYAIAQIKRQVRRSLAAVN
ncbi:hypothetical protein S-PM2d243 [Synechococcus phage S-PM2]|uniref:Hypothetical-Protein / belonging to T4-LIKE GC: 820 n=1 Tax=Synechococcus phage S-PM2 TaxID=238854 RepID=D8FRN3_BPSYP|nr:Hypothetical-Protein / belonging to T4-LIKE GC: 820 [Synechococcus phage S-PM2]CBR26940.1 Hypothetical-Protein / belonging to T4-LIKE GC: 820 [Synechococcus phage S-PM2]CFW42196.1 hypothetical protein S-PM2d243 [Synechococcus phage S-PM2]